MKEKAITCLLSNLIFILFFSDLGTKLLMFNNSTFIRFGSIIKLVIELVLIYIIIEKKLYKQRFFLIITTPLFIIFCLGQLNEYFINAENFFTDIFHFVFRFNTYIYLVLFAIVLSHRDNLKKIIYKNIIAIKYIGFINILFILLGITFKIQFFKSYPFSLRFGYNGLLMSSGIASFFFIFFITILLAEYFKTGKGLLKLLIVVIISFFVGTKTIWFFNFLVSLIFIYYQFVKYIHKRYRWALLAMPMIIISVFHVIKHSLKDFLVWIFPHGQYFYENYGILTLIFSTRDLILKKALINYKENANFFTYIFGGISDKIINVELELVKLFMFFGLAGTFVYFLFLKDFFFTKNQSLIKTLFFFAVIVTSIFSGALLYSVFNSLLFFIVFKYIDFLELKNYY